MTADTLDIVADFEENLILFVRVGNIIFFTKRAEVFFVAICFLPETGYLVDSLFDTGFVSVVFDGQYADGRLHGGRIDSRLSV